MNNPDKLTIEEIAIEIEGYNEYLREKEKNKMKKTVCDKCGKTLETNMKGKWIEMTDNRGHSSYFCSRCGTQEGKQYEVCPNCKAKMTVSN